MPEAVRGHEGENERIVLGLLGSVERDGAQSQRKLAADLGIALGLVNAYLKRCVTKGLVKMTEAPARRYAYYLTPKGFGEKARLTVDYLSSSFSFFRQAKADCAHVFAVARERGFCRVTLAGKSDLAEIAFLCAVESGVVIVALIDSHADVLRFVGTNVVASYDKIAEPFDAVVITDVSHAREVYDTAVARVGAGRVLAPALLNLPANAPSEAVP